MGNLAHSYSTSWLKLHRILLLLCSVFLAGCGLPSARERPLEVVATVLPLADWARQVGGARVHVRMLVPPRVDPRGYEPSAEQIKAIRNADVVLLNGLSLEPWIDEILDNARAGRMVVLDVSQFVGPLVEKESLSGPEAFEEGGAKTGPRARPGQEQLMPVAIRSPYLWLDPASASRQVDLIAQTLTRADPAGFPIYRQNASRYAGELDNLKVNMQQQVDRWKRRSLLSTDLFLYPFARHYGLPIKLVSDPKALATARPEQPVFLDGLTLSAQQKKVEGLKRPVAALNPLSGNNYIELMRTNMYTMTAAMAAH
jgi:ABC-type Zn uptake system ZnuABC Zn-binding protein ZnuA